jgi:hypothetical protein
MVSAAAACIDKGGNPNKGNEAEAPSPASSVRRSTETFIEIPPVLTVLPAQTTRRFDHPGAARHQQVKG